MNNAKKGFTLVELLVVIAILAILATVSVVGYTSFINNAKDSNAETELHQVVTYLEAELLVEKSFTVVDTKNTDDTADDIHYVISRNETGLSVAKYSYNSTSKKYDTVVTAATTDFDDALALISDFAELKDNTFTVSGFEITYTTTEGGKATDTLKFH